jgi:hypothetical protein
MPIGYLPAGPPGSGLEYFGLPVFATNPDTFRVRVDIGRSATTAEKKLAEEARQAIAQARPQNPSRRQTFRELEREDFPLKRLGWDLQIKRVTLTPVGWRALVHVRAIVRSRGGQPAEFGGYHIEAYANKCGKLTLESDSIRPGWDPSTPTGFAIF